MPSNDLSVKITADTVELVKAEKELGNFQRSFTSLNTAMEKNHTSWGKVTSGVTAASTAFMAINTAVSQYVIAPLKQAITTFMDFGDTISKTSQRVGIGVETLGGLKFAAEQCGANFQILTEGIKSFQNQVGAAQMGDAGAIGKLGKIGLSADAFAGLSNEDQLMKVADHIKSIGDKAEQTRVAMELFGKAGFKLLPFFQEGSEGIKKLIEEGKDIGAVMGEQATEDAVKMADAMNRMKTSASGISNVLISSLAPSIIAVLDGGTQLAKMTSKFIKDYGPVVTGIGSAVSAFVLLKGVMLGTTTVIPALVTGFNALKVAMLSNPYLLAGAAIIGGIAAAWSLWNKRIQETEEALRAMNEEARKMNEEAVKHEQAVMAANAADQKLFDRLQELADLEDPMNNDEIREANMLIQKLEGTYGKLGITIDETTGKIHGMAQAQAILNREQALKEIEALEARKKAIAEQKKALEAEEKQDREKHFQAIRAYNNKGTAQLSYAVEQEALGVFGRSKKRKEQLAALDQEAAGLTQRQNSLKQISNPKPAPAAKPETQEELTAKNKAAREEQTAAKSELAGMKADTDLMTPLERSYYELDQKYQKKISDLNKKIELAEKAGQDTSALYADFNKIEQWRQDEMSKIAQSQTEEQDRKAAADDAAWKERNPERATLPTKDPRVSAAESKVQAARQKQADAILSGGDLATADAALKAAQEELAKTVAEASGEARAQAAEELAAAQAKYDQAKRDGKDNQTLNELLAAVKAAQEKYDSENDRYFSAVGSLRKDTEEQAAEAVQTTLSSSGTFSAYGMDAAIVSDIPQQQLEVLRKLLDNTDEIKEEQKNEGTYTK